MVHPSAFLDRIRSVSCKALASGALQPISTTPAILPSNPPFLISVITNLTRKPQPSNKSNGTVKKPFNPFLPYDPELYVQDMGRDHVILLNKFNVVEKHILIVTKKFEMQSELLNERDFEAVWGCLKEVDGVGFFNSGGVAGASQAHKHVQVICGAVGGLEVGSVVPFDGIFSEYGNKSGGEVFRAVDMGFWHVGVGMSGVEGGRGWMERYMTLMGCVVKDERIEGNGRDMGYNLVMTRRWMVLVPRRKEGYRGIGVNGLGFVGCLLVKEERLLEIVKEVGGMEVLMESGFRE